MADWGRTIDEILDGMTLPQFRLLSKVRQRRINDNRRWDLQLVSFNLQSKEQSEAWADLMEELSQLDEGEEPQAQMGGGFTVSKRYPLLHELTEAQVMANPHLRKIVRFRTIKETEGGEP